MCTLVVVPRPGGYVLGHNRDERYERAPGSLPRLSEGRGVPFLAPRDPDGGGTWIAANAGGLSVAILNARGAAEPPDPMSRGLLALGLAPVRNLDALASRLEAERGILGRLRPFRLVAVQGAPAEPAPPVLEASWDGRRLRLARTRAPAAFVASSLDDPRLQAARRRVLDRFLSHRGSFGRSEVRDLLRSHEPAMGPLSLCMHGDRGGTVASTVVDVDEERVEMEHVQGPPCARDAPCGHGVLERL